MKRANLESLKFTFFQKVKVFLLALFPSKIKVIIYKIAGASIGEKVEIGLGSVVLAESFKKILINDYSSIRNFSLIICKEVTIGKYSEIAPFVWIWGNGKLNMGNKCYIGPRCIINLRNNNFNMGDYSGIGPGSIVYTHGQWLPYTHGWPRKYGDVTLENFSWVPARVFIAPDVIIGRESIIGSGAIVTKSIPPRTFAAGIPAKVISNVDDFKDSINEEELYYRAFEIARDFLDFFNFKIISEKRLTNGNIIDFLHQKWFSKIHYRLFVGDASKITTQRVQDIVTDLDLIIFSISEIPLFIQKKAKSWFDLKNLKCSAINDKLSFKIWNFLRETWCVTCDMVNRKNN